MSEDAVTDLTRGVYRRLYSGFIKGQRINKLSLQAEAWFWRVFAVADDFGNCEAEPELLRASTAGRRKVTAKQVERPRDHGVRFPRGGRAMGRMVIAPFHRDRAHAGGARRLDIAQVVSGVGAGRRREPELFRGKQQRRGMRLQVRR